MNKNKKKCLIILSHGSKNKIWINTFEKIKKIIKTYSVNINICLAFLENIKPNISVVIKNKIKKGMKHIVITPMLFGRGFHIQKYLPNLINKIIKKNPNVKIVLTNIVGENKKILIALSKYCIKQYNIY